jgi:predicted RNA-binding Zn-ribbon protein involved in translation (DUF1610 family)
MREEWTEKLRCPNCGKTGVASISQSDIYAPPFVEAVPDGFKVANNANGMTFQCEDCGVEVVP